MNPMIKPALRRSWRSRHTVQYGVTPARAVQLGPVDHATGCFLDLLDGTRTVAQLQDAARPLGLAAKTVTTVLDQLTGVGVLDDPTAERQAAALVQERLGPDLAALSLLHPEPGGAVRRLAARRTARVQVRGGGRVGAQLAALLSAAGVGEVAALDGGCVASADCAPGGVAPEHTGERRTTALRRAVRRATPWARPPGRQEQDPGRGYDLVVFAPRDGLLAYAPDPAGSRELVRAGRPHLFTGVVEGTGFVGPLVLPGATACAECLQLERSDREPGWSLVLGQWRSGAARGVPACDVALAAVVAGAAATAALRFLDRDGQESAGVRTSYVLPELRQEREEVPAYSGCPCGAASVATPSAPRIPQQRR